MIKQNFYLKWCLVLIISFMSFSTLKASASYSVETIAGLAGAYAHVDGVGTAARFKSPGMMSIDLSTGKLLEPDDDNNIRQITTAGGTYTVTTLFNYNIGSPPVQAVCAYITSDGTSAILTTDQWSHLYQWIQSGGTYVYNTSLDAISASDAYDGYGLVIDSSNNIFMTDAYEQVIYKILPNGSYSFFAGQAFSSGSTDGTGSAARFNGLTGITIDSSSNLYVSDTKNNTIRKITSAGVVTTIAGTAGASGSSNGVGSAARFNQPWDIDIDSAGNLYVADRGNNLIRKLTNNSGTYTVSTIAGTAGSSGSTDGVGSAARFNAPTGLAVDAFGSIFVSDTNNNTIRRLFTGATYSVPPGSTQTISETTSQPVVSGGGTAVLPPSNTVTNVEVANGILQVSSSAPVTFNAPTGGAAVVEVTSNTNTGPYNFVTAGSLQINTGVVATLSVPPAGTGVMSKTGPGSLEATSDLSSSTTPIVVSQGILGVSGSNGKLPTASTSVVSGAVLQLGIAGGTVVNGAVPGPADIASGAIISIPTNVHAPSNVFANPTFHSGITVNLGDGARISQNLPVVA